MLQLKRLPSFAITLAAALVAVPSAAVDAPGSCKVDGLTFAGMSDFVQSAYFQASGHRCGTPTREELLAALPPGTEELLLGGDCTASATNPDPSYDPGSIYTIPVVVHIIETTGGTGQISDALVDAQIDVLNEDFLALAGTPGANGVYSAIRFRLAETDPMGNPTTGVERVVSDTFFTDPGGSPNDMKIALNWDPTRYLNIYTNDAAGFLGYATFPMFSAGTAEDGVVILWSAFGRPSPLAPFHLGRTTTHEVGHYLGLFHTFQSGCGTSTPPGCNTTADLICDTNPESGPWFGPCATPPGTSCGFPRPQENFMDYSDDICMDRFTIEQRRRMRCAIETYRPDLRYGLFADGFESGDDGAWGP